MTDFKVNELIKTLKGISFQLKRIADAVEAKNKVEDEPEDSEIEGQMRLFD